MTAAEFHRRVLHYSGRVQGVGFRYTARTIARRFDVTGFVRNLTDGRVQLVVEGRAEGLDQFLSSVDDAMAGFIAERQVVTSAATGEFEAFEILY